MSLGVHSCLQTSASWLYLLIRLAAAFLQFADPVGPCVLDKGQDFHDFFILQHFFETGHVAFIAVPDDRRSSTLYNVSQYAVRMMPSMPRWVMRWGGQSAVWQS